jgi:hypothetical protein
MEPTISVVSAIVIWGSVLKILPAPHSLDQSKSKTFTHSKLARHHSLGSSPGVGSPSIAGPSTSSLAQQRGAASLNQPDDARGQSPKTNSMYSHSDCEFVLSLFFRLIKSRRQRPESRHGTWEAQRTRTWLEPSQSLIGAFFFEC